MRVLLLGGTGFIGSAIARRLASIPEFDLLVAARNKPANPVAAFAAVDATDAAVLLDLMPEVDVVVNCVTGSGETIVQSAKALADAATGAGRGVHIIHMSSMAVYGRRQGTVTENEAATGETNWYGLAKRRAEGIFRDYAQQAGAATMFRIGCAYGAGSSLWVDRIGLLIRQGRLGDLAELGDGWSNLVHAEDVAEAVALAAGSGGPGFRIYNVSAPDSPRWNSYFRDVALATGCIPLRYKPRWSMQLESLLIAPPAKVLERLSKNVWFKIPVIQSMPPSLLALWAQQIRLDSSKIERDLGLRWTPYQEGLAESAAYFVKRYGQ